MPVGYNSLVYHESESIDQDEAPSNYFLTFDGKSKKEDSQTCTIAAKLNFKNFHHYKKLDDINEHYELRKILNKGSFGKVWEATHVKTNFSCAVK